jgi:uncharacterized protein (TIGR02611 family)
MEETLKKAKKIIVLVVGMTVLILGVTMIVLPGPAIIVVPLGLAILGTEFFWAKKLLISIKQKLGLK